jgi:hypothetical protein
VGWLRHVKVIRRLMRRYRLVSKRDRRRREMLDLEGAGWDGDLARMRSSRVRRI